MKNTIKKGDTVTLIQYNNSIYVHEIVISEVTVKSSGKLETMLDKHYTKFSTEALLDTNYDDMNILGYKIAPSEEDVERYTKRQKEILENVLAKLNQRLEDAFGRVRKQRIGDQISKYSRPLEIVDLRKNKEVA